MTSGAFLAVGRMLTCFVCAQMERIEGSVMGYTSRVTVYCILEIMGDQRVIVPGESGGAWLAESEHRRSPKLIHSRQRRRGF